VHLATANVASANRSKGRRWKGFVGGMMALALLVAMVSGQWSTVVKIIGTALGSP